MPSIEALLSPVASFLMEEAGASFLELALVGLMVVVVGMLLLLAFEKGI
jgi:hypothetical protein